MTPITISYICIMYTRVTLGHVILHSETAKAYFELGACYNKPIFIFSFLILSKTMI